MCSVYNYTVNLLCSRRDNIINKPADGTVLTQKGLEVYKKVKERSEQQYRVESKVGNECLVSRKDCLGNKQTVRIDKIACSCGCYRCLCPHLMCALCECAKENDALMFLSTVYGAEGYKESYSFTDSDSPIHYTRGAKVTDLCEWEMSVPAGRMRTKRLKGVSEGGTIATTTTSRGRKKKVNLLKKIIKDEMNEEEKKYFGKEEKKMEVEEDNSNSDSETTEGESDGESEEDEESEGGCKDSKEEMMVMLMLTMT